MLMTAINVHVSVYSCVRLICSIENKIDSEFSSVLRVSHYASLAEETHLPLWFYFHQNNLVEYKVSDFNFQFARNTDDWGTPLTL